MFKKRFLNAVGGGGNHEESLKTFGGVCVEMPRGKDAKRHGLLRFELFKKIEKFLSLNLRNILISPLEGEKKFLSELCELSNKGRLGILAQREAGFEPSPAFVMLTEVRKRLLPLTKREGCDSVISSDFKSKISITNENNLSCKDLSYFGRSALLCRQGRDLSALVPQYLSDFSDKVFSRFTSHFSRKRTAFTLAEVLITLGIIGVVAALTLPVIISDVKNSQLEAGLKKAYSVLGQALNMYQAENGERIVAGDATNRRMIKSYLMQYIKSAKDCGFGGSDNKEGLEKACLPNNYTGIDGDFNGSAKYETYNGKSSIALDYFDDGQFVTPDGMLILIENSGGQWFGDQVFISVDVNGYNKKPNRLGQDLFMFQIDKNGALLPMGAKDTKYYSISDAYCSNTSTNSMNGAGCTNLALMDKNFFKKLPR